MSETTLAEVLADIAIRHQRIPMYAHIPGLMSCSAGCPELRGETDGPNSPHHATHVAGHQAAAVSAWIEGRLAGVREDVANTVPLGWTDRDPYRDVHEAADAALATVARALGVDAQAAMGSHAAIGADLTASGVESGSECAGDGDGAADPCRCPECRDVTDRFTQHDLDRMARAFDAALGDVDNEGGRA